MDYVGRPTVLLVEDSEFVRLVAHEALEGEGFEVIEAEDGLAALEVIAAGRPIHAVFSDVDMPRLTGLELAQKLRAAQVAICILLTSGKYMPASLPPDVRFIGKPYDFQAVARLLREMLTSESGAKGRTQIQS